MKKQLLLFMMMLLPMVAWGDAVEIDGIWYNLDSTEKQAEVTMKPSGEYSGAIVIPEKVIYYGAEYSVTSIGKSAFAFCSGMTSVTIPNSVTIIGSEAFAFCNGMTSVHISDLEAWCKISFHAKESNPLYYAHHLYMNGIEITNLVIPDSVTSIENYAFDGCSGLTSVTIGNSVKSIGYNAFFECAGLTSVAIGNSVTSIREKTFAYCSALTSVIIGNSVTSIGSRAFYYCSGLTSVTIPNSVTIIESEAFAYCSGLTSITIPNSVTNIGSEAFSHCSCLTSITIPNSVTSIGFAVFSECTGLTSVTIPNSVTRIGKFAFDGCSGLTSVTIPNSVTSIGNYAFYGCSGLTSVMISNSVTSIGEYAFCGCSGLTSITIPNSVTSIGYGAFSKCSGLTSVTIPNSVTSIDGAFSKCSGLTSVTIPNSVTSIGYGAFSKCSGLTSITIPNSVTSIGEYAFYGCSGLTSITIPNSVTSIGEYAFDGCSGLTSITIPNSVTSIGNWGFSSCSSLTSITIPNSVTSIGNYAFYKCTVLTFITIGNSVTSIGGSAFYGCEGLIDVTCLAESVPSTKSDAFAYSSINNATLHVPESSIETYKSTEPWKRFKEIVALSDNENPIVINGVYYTLDTSNKTAKMTSLFNNISEIAIPSSITSNSLEYIITSIGERAFSNGTNLISITIPQSLSEIGDYAFSGCTKLIEVYCNAETVPIVSGLTFENSNITNATLYVPAGTKSLYNSADGWKLFANIVEKEVQNNNITFTDPAVKAICVANWDTNGDGELSEAEAAAVTSLNKVFSNNRKITSFDELRYFTGLTSITDEDFYCCKALTTITLPKNLAEVPESSFTGCESLESINVAEGSEYYCTVDGILYDKNVSLMLLCPCKKTGDVVISATVRRIGTNAFYMCARLTSITLPDLLEELGDAVFIGCTSLKTIHFPASVMSMGLGQFSQCTSLESITVDEANTHFESKDGVLFSKDEKSLKSYPNKKGKEYVMPEGYELVEDYAFCMTEIEKVTLPKSLVTLNLMSLGYCENLMTVICLNPTPKAAGIRLDAFDDASYERITLYVPYGSKSLYQASNGWNKFTNIVEMEEPNAPKIITFADPVVKAICVANWDTDGDGEMSEAEAAAVENLNNAFFSNQEITSFDELQYFTGLTAINGDFYACTSLTSIIIPENVTTIGLYNGWGAAFAWCYDLTSVTLGDKVKTIGERSFQGCSSLSSINLPHGVETIGVDAFYGCSALPSLIIPSSVEYIYDGAFDFCSGLTSIVVDEGNRYYDSRENCNALIATQYNTLIVGSSNSFIPNTVTSISRLAFRFRNGLNSLTIPKSVTRIGNEAFAGCVGLNYIIVEEGNPTYDSRDNCNAIIETAKDSLINGSNNTIIPHSVKKIAPFAFQNCSGLTSLTIPSSITSIGESAFNNCAGPNLLSIMVEEGNPTYDSRDNCNAIIETETNSLLLGCKNTIFPDNVMVIGPFAFRGCSDMTSIRIPNSVRSIEESAFYECSGLSSVVIGKSVEMIGAMAFYCPNLQDVYCYADNVPNAWGQYGNDAFRYSNIEGATLHVPASSVDAYSANDIWKKFGSIVALQDNDPKPTGIRNVNNDIMIGERYYSLDGKRLATPQRGINIVKMGDGTTRKIVVK